MYQESNYKKKQRILIACGCVATLVIVSVCGYFIYSKIKQEKYESIMLEVEKDLAIGSSDDAIVLLEDAMDLEPSVMEPYLKLADIYEENGDYDKAKEVLDQGIKSTSDKEESKTEDSKTESSNTEDTKTAQNETEEKKTENTSENNANNDNSKNEDGSSNSSKNKEDETKPGEDEDDEPDKPGEDSIDIKPEEETDITFNQDLILELESYTYEDYVSNYGKASTNLSNNILEVVHKYLDATFYYQNTSDNTNIVNTSKKCPYDQAMPFKASFNDLSLLIDGFGEYISIDTLQTITGQNLKVQTYDNHTVLKISSTNSDFYIECDEDGTVDPLNAWNELELTNANSQSETTEGVKGTIKDVTTKDPVKDVKLVFTDKNGDKKSYEVVTDKNGEFSLDLTASTYKVKISKDEYVDEEYEIEIKEGKQLTLDYTICSKTAANQARIVLEWNAEPKNLDAYLSGKTDKNISVEINTQNKECKDGQTVIASLKEDDTDGYGPEIITLNELNGTYTFTVKDKDLTGTMAKNGVTVKVYLPEKSVQTITLKSDSKVKNVWTVFELKNGVLKVLNKSGD